MEREVYHRNYPNMRFKAVDYVTKLCIEPLEFLEVLEKIGGFYTPGPDAANEHYVQALLVGKKMLLK